MLYWHINWGINIGAKLDKPMLEKEFQYYLDNQEILLKKFQGRFIVIKNEKVIGDYSTEIDALMVTQENHEVGTFLIQKCTPGETDYTETYHSRVTLHA